MAIQSSINSLLSQAQSLATFYRGFKKADDIIGDTTAAKDEAKIQTDIAAGLAPMKDGKVDPEWLQKRREEREEFEKKKFNDDGTLSRMGETRARFLQRRINKGIEPNSYDKQFYDDSRVQEYLKSFNESLAAKALANKRVVERTNSINQSKSDFDEHVASLIRYYGKGSGNP